MFCQPDAVEAELVSGTRNFSATVKNLLARSCRGRLQQQKDAEFHLANLHLRMFSIAHRRRVVVTLSPQVAPLVYVDATGHLYGDGGDCNGTSLAIWSRPLPPRPTVPNV